MKKEVKGFDYLNLALLAFLGIGIEVVLAFLIEPKIYGVGLENWTDCQSILHWIIISIIWGAFGYGLLRSARKNYGFAEDNKKKVSKFQKVLLVILIIIVAINSYIDWKGFKIIREYNNLGLLKFIFQYIYYAFETLLFMLIIVFSQKAFEIWLGKENFPYGGLICGLTWGIGHIFTKNFLVGIRAISLGLIFGIVYLLLNKDLKKTYMMLFLMFII